MVPFSCLLYGNRISQPNKGAFAPLGPSPGPQAASTRLDGHVGAMLVAAEASGGGRHGDGAVRLLIDRRCPFFFVAFFLILFCFLFVVSFFKVGVVQTKKALV